MTSSSTAMHSAPFASHMRSKSGANGVHSDMAAAAPSIAIYLDDGEMEQYDEKRHIYKSPRCDQCKIAKWVISAIICIWIIIVFYTVGGPSTTSEQTKTIPEDVFKTWVNSVKETGYGPSPLAILPPSSSPTHSSSYQEQIDDLGLSDDEIEQWDLQSANSNTQSNMIADDDDELDGFEHHHEDDEGVQNNGLYMAPSDDESNLSQDQEVPIAIIPPQRLAQDEYGNDIEV